MKTQERHVRVRLKTLGQNPVADRGARAHKQLVQLGCVREIIGGCQGSQLDHCGAGVDAAHVAYAAAAALAGTEAVCPFCTGRKSECTRSLKGCAVDRPRCSLWRDSEACHPAASIGHDRPAPLSSPMK